MGKQKQTDMRNVSLREIQGMAKPKEEGKKATTTKPKKPKK